MDDHALAGTHVVVTRPAHQADNLCHLIEAQGGCPIRFPVLEIAAPRDLARLDGIISRLSEFDIAIFISPNAVSHAMVNIAGKGGMPPHVQVAAVGQASAKALAAYNQLIDLYPKDSFNSEALLDLDELKQVAGKKIVIFRGEGGRELLADTLTQRGAEVEYAECYRRVKPNIDVQPLLQHWQHGEVDIIISTSNEGLQNLLEMVTESGRQMLLNTQLLLVSERSAEFAQQLGFTQPPIIATKASDEALLQALIEWRQSKR